MFYRFSVNFIEIAAVLLFILTWSAFKDSRQKAGELVSAFFYGLLLEELDIYFFRTYHYGPGFFLQIGSAPLAIAFLWSVILASSMAISDRLGLPEYAKPFADGLLALLIDIGVDAIAIRIGYWTWTIPLSEGWFGVPAGNLYAWMWVAFSYSAATRLVRWMGRKDPGRYAYQVLVPFAAYLFLFIEIICIGLLSLKFGLKNESQRLWIFYGHVAVFTVAAGLGFLRRNRQATGKKVPAILLCSRLFIHLYFLAALAATKIVFHEPRLATVAAAAFLADSALCLRKTPVGFADGQIFRNAKR